MPPSDHGAGGGLSDFGMNQLSFDKGGIMIRNITLSQFVLFLSITSAAQTPSVKTLVNFNVVNGSFASSTPVQGPDGALYGTTQGGGANSKGTVFRVTLSGKGKTLYSFCAQSNCSDGAFPLSGLLLAADGNLYGTTSQYGFSLGTVFKITTAGVLTTVHTFTKADGYDPACSLIQDSSGNFYGTTQVGGANNDGTIFMITSSGTFTKLHDFDGTDGAAPYSELLLASDGNLYGTAPFGGTDNLGTVFCITPSGTLTVLHSFVSAEGNGPRAGLVQASDGNLYGTNTSGPLGRYGTIFRITLSGTLTILHKFNGWNGQQPCAAMIQASDGDLYGTTLNGGIPMINEGNIFKITLAGEFTRLYSFPGMPTGGAMPMAGLLQATDGNFYGTTLSGGVGLTDAGTVFKVVTGLGSLGH